MNKMFKGKSLSERGTMAQLRNDFGHRNVTMDVMNCYNYADDFNRFLTEAHIVYLTMYICQMDELENTPNGSIPRGTLSNRSKFIQSVSERVVDTIWMGPFQSEIDAVVEAELSNAKEKWCICDQDG